MTRNENSAFYSADSIDRNLLNKDRKFYCVKDNVLVKLYSELEAKIVCMYVDENNKIAPPAYMSFVEQRKDIDRLAALYSFKGPFELLHADISVIKFLAKSEVNQKYCLLFVDLFTSKIYTYPMKNRSLLKI